MRNIQQFIGLRRTKHIINSVIWSFVAIYFIVVILLHIPTVQYGIGSAVESAISSKLGTNVSVGRVDLGFLNRIIIDDVIILDKESKKMIVANRLSAKFDYLPLFKGQISISSAQLFGLHAFLYKKDANAKPNYQFLIDSLSSKDTTKQSNLDLNINSLVIRHGKFKYDRLDIAKEYNKFDINHFNINDISSHIMLNKITNDSININCKNLSLKNLSGVDIKSLSFKIYANKSKTVIKDFKLNLPNSSIILDNIIGTYKYKNKKYVKSSLRFSGILNKSKLTLKDISGLVNPLNDINQCIYISSTFSGTDSSIKVKNIEMKSIDKTLQLTAQGQIEGLNSHISWNTNVSNLKLDSKFAESLLKQVKVKKDILTSIDNIGHLSFRGKMSGNQRDFNIKGIINTDIGNTDVSFSKYGNQFKGGLLIDDIDLKRLLVNEKLGLIAANINVSGSLQSKRIHTLKVDGNVSKMDYNSYTYHNISLNGIYNNGTIDGVLGMNDPNANIDINGKFDLQGNKYNSRFVAHVRNFNPSALNIYNKWQDATFDFDVSSDLYGKDINNIVGTFDLNKFSMKYQNKDFIIDNLSITSGVANNKRTLSLKSNLGSCEIDGKFDYSSLSKSFTNLLRDKLPTIPGLPKAYKDCDNDFSIRATINSTEWLKQFFNVPLSITQPIILNGSVIDKEHNIYVDCSMPSLTYDGARYENGSVRINTLNDTLKVYSSLKKILSENKSFSCNVVANAIDNHLSTIINFNNNQTLRGCIDTDTQFFKNKNGVSSAHVNVHNSDILIGDTIWHVNPSDIIYSKNDLLVDNFMVQHNDQHLIIDGRATNNVNDSIFVNLKDIDVSYIMNMINFHSVDFGGSASGDINLASVFNKPIANAKLQIKKFLFEDGRLGTLYADAKLNNEAEQIDIDAIAKDEDQRETVITGYVSPFRSCLDLNIHAKKTRLEFVESFCKSFLCDVNADGQGNVRVFGDFKNVNLEGQVVATGSLGVSSLNTSYTLRNDTVNFIPDKIIFSKDTIRDAYGNIGVINGTLNHKHLTNMTYDFAIKARNLLSYDTHDFGTDTFYGTAYATGTCKITGRSGEVNIDVNARPEKGSMIVYNVSSPEAIGRQDFIHWKDRDEASISDALAMIFPKVNTKIGKDDSQDDIPTDMHINFLIQCNENATIKLLMDNATGDYIALNGSGTMRATYYNKGGFDMYGNYVVDHGIYKLTIQNVIKKDFQFQQGGVISFGGDPYNASLNLQATYLVNGVSLSDLNIGRSFTSNNIRVNCIMNITGSPNTPKVDFTMDMPTVNSDAKQMIYNLINSEEEMNQQVLYLLAVGRFYTQGTNNAVSENNAVQQSQTSLAMQSILSGTLSQQINNVLSSVLNNNNWNFGANISTGDEGFNNAEYEGLLSGRLLNNRLLINGQFGYRDNANATTSFIGDFDIRYLLYPSGNLSVKVYNQTNDRYFTRNSLNTQGIGLVMKKDFNGLRDLFGIRRKQKKATETTPKK